MVKFIDIPKLMESALKEMTSKKNLRILGEDAKRLIQKRTRLGGGVERSLGPRTKLKSLSESYKKQRKKNKVKLDRTTTPARSNLTFTGGMLRDIGVKVSKAKVSLRFITPFAKDKAKWVQDAGREFFNITKPEFKQLQNKVRKQVQRVLTKLK